MSTAWQPVRDASGSSRRLTLDDLARRVDGRLEGVSDPEQEIEGVRPLESAAESDLSFVHAGSYLKQAASSRAAAFLIPESLDPTAVAAELGERPRIVVRSSQLAVAQALDEFFVLPRPSPGVHPTAVVGKDCELGEGVAIGPYAVIGDGCHLADGVVVEAHTVVGRDCVVGTDSWLHANCVLYDGSVLGERVRVHSGAIVGGHGFGYASVAGIHHKIPQVGRAVLGDDVEVGCGSAVDRALVDETRIGEGTKIDNQVQVGHNVRTGRGCLLCGQAGIGGTARLGDHVVLAGQVGVVDHAQLGDGVSVAAGSKVLRSVDAGRTLGGAPRVQDIGDWRRASSAVTRLPELLRRVKRLERQLAELSSRSSSESDDRS
ncbi:MAG: UDP-3-O-(3-hydroxymyristoyl)glucosamine N-acyltransferase [Thermoanaerobaculia bacterium]|nr:UDP-3-O-(3-hydroxymyristoyl)glucosamine N-acyltransferase [Thermoanaerobaculia bacterium]